MKMTQNNQLKSRQEPTSLMRIHHSQTMVIYTHKTDSEVWNAFKKGDEAAFNYIYRKFVPGLYNYGYQICKDNDLVKDCVQVLFIELRRKRKRLSDVKSIKGYLFTIFYRELIKLLKTRQNQGMESIEGSEKLFPIEVSHETKLINEEWDDEMKKELNKALNQLPTRQRQALLLLYKENLSYEEIAGIMEFKEVKTARTLVYRAISNMRAIFKLS